MHPKKRNSVYGSGIHKIMVIEKPAENLDEATIKAAMQKIVDTHAFEKTGKKEFEAETLRLFCVISKN